MRAHNLTRGCALAGSIRVADTFRARLKGLLGEGNLPDGEGLWLSPCKGIHSFGMRYEFDAVFLDGASRAVGLYSRFPRNRISRIFWSARGVLELPAGTIEQTGTEVGDEIEFRT